MNYIKKERGMIEHLALLVLLVLMIYIFSYMETTQLQSKSVTTVQNSIIAKYNAESGIDEFISLFLEYGLNAENIVTDYITTTSDTPSLNGKEITNNINNGKYRTVLDTYSNTLDTNGDIIEKEIILYSYGYYKNTDYSIKTSIILYYNTGVLNYDVIEWYQE